MVFSQSGQVDKWVQITGLSSVYEISKANVPKKTPRLAQEQERSCKFLRRRQYQLQQSHLHWIRPESTPNDNRIGLLKLPVGHDLVRILRDQDK